MLMGGKKPPTNVKTLVLPREAVEPVVFKAGAVTTMDEFDRLCPIPQAPIKNMRDGTKVPDVSDNGYKKHIEQLADKRIDYIVLESLKATPELTWETVDFKNPDTWRNWRKECTDAGLSIFEVNRIVALAIEANALSETTLEEARQTFLAGPAVT